MLITRKEIINDIQYFVSTILLRITLFVEKYFRKKLIITKLHILIN